MSGQGVEAGPRQREPAKAGQSQQSGPFSFAVVTAARYRELARSNSFPIVVASIVVVLLFAAGSALLNGFLSISSIDSILVLSSFLGIAAIGETVAVLLAGIDLAIPFIIDMSNVIAAQLTQDGVPFILSMLVALAAGAAVGCFNGYIAQRLRIHPLIITLGVGYMAQAAVEIWTKGAPSGLAPTWLGQVVSIGSTIGGVHVAPVVLVWAVVSAAVIFMLNRTSFGRRVYAVGTNLAAAQLALISPVRIWTFAFGISGLFAALSGVLLLGFTGGSLATVGDSYLFLAVGAVVVGGTSLVGGRGGYTGTIIGAVLITLLSTILVGLRQSEAVQELIIGVVIIVAVSLFGREAHVRDRV